MVLVRPLESQDDYVVEYELAEGEQPNLVTLIDEPAWKSILLDLVRREKMDVWAIDIAELAQKYLEKIQQLKVESLRVPANAILATAILLRLKARTIHLSFSDEEEEKTQGLSEEEILSLNAALPDLIPTSKLREGRVTLDELMGHIASIMEQTSKKSQRMAQRRARRAHDFVMPVLSETDLADKIEEVYALVTRRVDEQGLVLFSDLVNGDSPLETIETFIPLLFLQQKGRLGLMQEDFFGEIIVCVPATNP